MTIEKGLIGKEDIHFGSTGTFQRKDSSGSNILITKLNAGHLPIVDSAGRFTSTDVDGALAECQVENAIGSNSKDYINKSGAERSLGDVVVVDTDADDSYKTTTTEGVASILGVVGETTADNASGKVITGGYISTVTVDAATSRGNYLKSSSTAGKATPSTEFVNGSFAIALSATGGPGTVSGFLFGSIGGSYVPLAGGVMTGTLTLSKGADVASASALSLGSDGNYFDVTGTTGITSINTVGVGTVVVLHFDGAVTLTHHSTNLILPGGSNLTTSGGDELTFVEYATGDWRCIGYTPYVSYTGTGDVVRKTSPTLTTPILTTPKVDVINEENAGAGVTIDGLLLKDNYIQSTNNVSGVKQVSIDWANAGGITQGLLLDEEYTKASAAQNTWYTVDTNYVYIPSNSNSLEYIGRMKVTGVTKPVEMRLTTDTNNGSSTNSTTNSSYTWLTTPGTLDVSDKSGWTNINIQVRTTGTDGPTVYINKGIYRIK